MVDYLFYTNEYLLGKEPVVKESDFRYYERKAVTLLHAYTYNNICENEPIPDTVKFCVCELIENLYTAENTKSDRNGVTSEKDGTWSASYETTEQTTKNANEKNRSIIYTWLSDTGYLYSGVHHEKHC